MPAQVEAHDSFGAMLRHYRLQADMSLSSLAEAVYFSKSHLSKVENGHKSPSVLLARRCDEILQTGNALNALVRSTTPNTSRNTRTQGAGTVNERSWPHVNPPYEILGLTPGDLEPLETWRSVFVALRQAGQRSGPRSVIPVAEAAVQAVTDIALRLPSQRRAQALITASRISMFVGWMQQEAGLTADAVTSTDGAAELAQAAGDDELTAYALVRKGLMALYDNDWTQTIQLAERAQRLGRDPRVLGLAAQREAQGHAARGDTYHCLTAIDRAGDHFRRATTPDDPAMVIGTSHVADPAAMVAGWCFYDLGKPHRSVEVLTAQIALIPTDAHRSRARWGARLALSLAAIRELEQACDVLEPVLRAAATLGSATIRQDLRRVNAALLRWDDHPRVRRLTPALTAISTGQI